MASVGGVDGGGGGGGEEGVDGSGEDLGICGVGVEVSVQAVAPHLGHWQQIKRKINLILQPSAVNQKVVTWKLFFFKCKTSFDLR